MPHAYRCRDFPGMGNCPGYFVAATHEEVLRLTELHAEIAHGEDPDEWPPEDRQQVENLIKPLEPETG